MSEMKIVVEGDVRAFFDSGMFYEVNGIDLGEMIPEGVIRLGEGLEAFGTKRIRVTVEVLDDSPVLIDKE